MNKSELLCCTAQNAEYWGEIAEARQHLLRFLTEEEALVEFGLIKAAADDSNGTVVCSAVILSPELKQLSLTRHVLSERFKTRPIIRIIHFIFVVHIRRDFTPNNVLRESYLIKVLDISFPSVLSEQQ